MTGFKLNIHFKILLIVVCIKILASLIFGLHLYNLHVSYSVVLYLRTWGWDIEYLHLIVHHDLDKYIYVLISFLFVLSFRFIIDSTLLWVPTGFLIILCNTRVQFYEYKPLIYYLHPVHFYEFQYIVLYAYFLPFRFYGARYLDLLNFTLTNKPRLSLFFTVQILLLIVHFYESQWVSSLFFVKHVYNFSSLHFC